MKIGMKIIILILIILININSFLVFTTVYKATTDTTFQSLTGKAQNSRVELCIDWFLNFTVIDDQIAYINQSYYLDINVTDESSYYPQLNFTLNNTDLFDINDTTGEISFTPNSSQRGNYSYNVSVGNGACEDPDDTTVFNLVVRDSNYAPILNMSNQSLVEEVPFYLNVSQNATDPNNDPLKFYDNSSRFVIGEDSGIIAFTPDDEDNGNWTVKIYVVDPSLALDSQDVLFSVRPVNDIPNLTSIGAQTLYINESFTINLSAYDPDEAEELNFSSNTSWFFNSSGFIETNDSYSYHTISGNFTNYTRWFNTTHSINMTVTDLNGTQDSEVISLTILTMNHPPEITSYYPVSQQLSLSTTDCQDFNITKYDPDGTIPSTQWYLDDVSLGVTNDSYTYCSASAGTYNLTVTITDGEYNASESWILTVSAPPPPPPETRTVPSGKMGGSAAFPRCVELWVCTDWSNCSKEEIQTRECKDKHGCGTLKNKPEETKNCTYTAFPSCNDGIKNQNEILPDCGGVCKPCPTCDDGIRNQGEQGIDCGGPCPVCKEVLAPVKAEKFDTKDLFFSPGLYWFFWMMMSVLVLTMVRLKGGIKGTLSKNLGNKLVLTLQVMKTNNLLKKAYREADNNHREKAKSLYQQAQKIYKKLPKDKKSKVHIRDKI